MSKDAKKSAKGGKSAEAQLLDLLRKVLPKATHDPELAGKIYEAIEQELQVKHRTSSFDKFCSRCELPDLEPQSIEAVQAQLAASFDGADITVKPNKKEKCLAVEVSMPDGTQLSSLIPVRTPGEVAEEQEVTLKFIPFPVVLSGDKELIWYLAKRENMTPDEATVALTKLEDDFWATKAGQKMIRDGVERCFPEFIARVPNALMTELGLKRHYKYPEPICVMRSLKKTR